VPLLFAITVAQIVCPFSITERIFVVIIPVLFAAFNSLFDLFMNVLMPNLTWTSEIYPIKQSMSVFISVFTGMVYTGLCTVLFVFLVPFVGITVYYLIITALTLVASLLILRWLDTKGSRKFSIL
ncbi:MAG: hypothetical protein J5850_06170, partial [Clostridia bacterium]|nr:hypothetical protein [Clostridia bacterium]